MFFSLSSSLSGDEDRDLHLQTADTSSSKALLHSGSVPGEKGAERRQQKMILGGRQKKVNNLLSQTVKG